LTSADTIVAYLLLAMGLAYYLASKLLCRRAGQRLGSQEALR
jgi:hypothetical protein